MTLRKALSVNKKGTDTKWFSDMLKDWYRTHKRDLPWRNTKDPYVIWLSEVILQQTRVAQGYDYFLRFINKYPTVSDLADAEEEQVLKLWQGLGYYSRARNLLEAARVIKDKYNGHFPSQYSQIKGLKGVGEYTAAAIVSFAFNQPYAVVDGNVYRVLSRIFAVDQAIDTTSGKKYFAELADFLLDTSERGLYNQAIMEFGALQCVPVSPDCERCPATTFCQAKLQCKVQNYPVKQGKTKKRDRFFNYFDIRYGNDIYLKKRTQKDVWQNMYEFPLIEANCLSDLDELIKSECFLNIFGENRLQITYINKTKHVLSHQTIYASFFKVELQQELPTNEYLKINTGDIDKYPVSRLIHKYIEKYITVG